MTAQGRLAIRAASRIHARLRKDHERRDSPRLPHHGWWTAERLIRLIEQAERRGWRAAARRLSDRLEVHAHQLQAELRQLIVPDDPSPLISEAELYREIRALHGEFDEVKYSFAEEWLSVLTDPITLDDFDLGPFEIRLSWSTRWTYLSYSLLAREPNCPEHSQDTTHPHVQNNHLCAGDGQRAIERALWEGRLFDFFTLVTRILSNYNEDSAYVRLDQWSGSPCSGCGGHCSTDEGYSCHRCGDAMCEDCVIFCNHCDDGYCAGCLVPCEKCETWFCTSGLEACSSCGRRFCSICLEEGELCEECREAQTLEDDNAGDVPAALEAPIQPDCLGEAAVST